MEKVLIFFVVFGLYQAVSIDCQYAGEGDTSEQDSYKVEDGNGGKLESNEYGYGSAQNDQSAYEGIGSEPYSGHSGSYPSGHSFSAAIVSEHSVQSYPVHSTGGTPAQPTSVHVDAAVAPIVLHIDTRSSPIIAKHKHFGHGGSYKKSFSKDRPHYGVHVVTKPVIHELKEIITPFRKLTQKVKPVKQRIQTFVHHNKHHHY